jgi:hypothetical protein
MAYNNMMGNKPRRPSSRGNKPLGSQEWVSMVRTMIENGVQIPDEIFTKYQKLVDQEQNKRVEGNAGGGKEKEG